MILITKFDIELFEKAPLNPPDPIFNLNTQFKADSFVERVNVGIGAYRTDEGKPWVLPTVKKVEKALVNDPGIDHEYLPIDGLASFTEASARLVLGQSSPAILEKRVRNANILLLYKTFSIAQCKQSQGLDLCVWALHLLLVLRQELRFIFRIRLGDLIGLFSQILV